MSYTHNCDLVDLWWRTGVNQKIRLRASNENGVDLWNLETKCGLFIEYSKSCSNLDVSTEEISYGSNIWRLIPSGNSAEWHFEAMYRSECQDRILTFNSDCNVNKLVLGHTNRDFLAYPVASVVQPFSSFQHGSIYYFEAQRCNGVSSRRFMSYTGNCDLVDLWWRTGVNQKIRLRASNENGVDLWNLETKCGLFIEYSKSCSNLDVSTEEISHGSNIWRLMPSGNFDEWHFEAIDRSECQDRFLTFSSDCNVNKLVLGHINRDFLVYPDINRDFLVYPPTDSPTDAPTDSEQEEEEEEQLCAIENEKAIACRSNKGKEVCCPGLVCHRYQYWRCVNEENVHCSGPNTLAQECGAWKTASPFCCPGLICDGNFCVPPTDE